MGLKHIFMMAKNEGLVFCCCCCCCFVFEVQNRGEEKIKFSICIRQVFVNYSSLLQKQLIAILVGLYLNRICHNCQHMVCYFKMPCNTLYNITKHFAIFAAVPVDSAKV